MAVEDTVRFSQEEVYDTSNFVDFIARRLMDLAERQGTNISMILLDWENCFDNVDQCRLVETLSRFSSHEIIITAIRNIYREAKFRVARGENKSGFHEQNSRIRPGCPLSPYLFRVIMTAIFHDIKSVLNTTQKEHIPGLHYAEILYADDILISGTHTHSINKLLHQIQKNHKHTT